MKVKNLKVQFPSLDNTEQEKGKEEGKNLGSIKFDKLTVQPVLHVLQLHMVQEEPFPRLVRNWLRF